jgi:hypothetical protein
MEHLAQLRECQVVHHSFLNNEEIRWQLEIRAVCINMRDNNTIVFHNYAKFWKNIKTMKGVVHSNAQSIGSGVRTQSAPGKNA